MKMSSNEIANILIAERHPITQWISVREMRCGCGYGAAERSIDLWCIKAAPSSGMPAVSYEIKLSRSDFMKDIKDPEKQRGAKVFSDKIYYVAPKGVIPVELVPDWAGLIEIQPVVDPPEGALPRWKQKRAVTVKKSYPRSKEAPSWSFMISAFRRIKIEEGVSV